MRKRLKVITHVSVCAQIPNYAPHPECAYCLAFWVAISTSEAECWYRRDSKDDCPWFVEKQKGLYTYGVSQ